MDEGSTVEYEEFEEYPGLFWFGNVLIITTGIITIFGNALTILAFALNESLRRAGNFFLISLAVADLCSGVICLLFMVHFECNPLAEDLLDALTYLFVFTSILHLVLIAVDRFIMVYHPVKYGDIITEKTATIVPVTTWVGMACFMLLPMFVYAANDYECDGILNITYYNYFGIICYLIMILSVTIIYARIIILVKREPNRMKDVENTIITPGVSNVATGYSNMNNENASHMNIDDSDDLLRSRAAQRKKKSLTVLFVLILAVFILWTPYMIYTFLAVIGAIDPMDHAAGEVEYILFAVGLVNSAVNTFVYASISTEFREAYGDVIKCVKLRQKCGGRQSRGAEQTDQRDMDFSSTNF